MINHYDKIGKKIVRLFSRYKKEILRHGYKKDRCFRCDESIVLFSLVNIGITKKHHLIKDLRKSLINKQQLDGSWHFRGKKSPWYTLEVLKTLECVDAIQ